MDIKEFFLGYDEPEEMWMTGKSAILLQTALGLPLVDAEGEPLDEKQGYFLSKKTGLIRMTA